jgi:hypothetical protein
MKIYLLFAFFSLQIISAEWANWSEYQSCSEQSQVIESSTFTYKLRDETHCEAYCWYGSQYLEYKYGTGDMFCCQYEKYLDGTFSCHLFESGDRIDTLGAESEVQSFTFEFGE